MDTIEADVKWMREQIRKKVEEYGDASSEK